RSPWKPNGLALYAPYSGQKAPTPQISLSSPTADQRAAALGATARLFPLDRAGRLRGEIQRDAIDAADLVDDPVGHPLQQVVGEAGPIGGHRILGGNGADHDRVGVGAFVALYPDR